MDNVVFTQAALFELLASIKELEDYELSLTETIDGNLQLQVGDSVYEISTEQATEVMVDEQVVDQIDDINVGTYEDLIESDESTFYNSEETIEGGIIKGLAKTLLVGGLVRLSAKLLGKELGTR